MVICCKCTMAISGKSPGIACSVCEQSYHARCGGVEVKLLKSFESSEAVWVCPACRCKPGRRSSLLQPEQFDTSEGSSRPSSTESITLEKIYSVQVSIQSEIRSVNTRIDQLNNKYDKIIESLDFCWEKVNLLENKMLSLEKLASTNTQLMEETSKLNNKVDYLEQYSRRNNLEICGVVEARSENVYDIVKDIGGKLDVVLDNSTVDAATRVAHMSNSSNLPKTIVLTCRSKRIKEDVLAAVKKCRQAYMVEHPSSKAGLMLPGYEQHPLYINDHLTPKNKMLLKLARDAAKRAKYQFTWVKNGFIYVRKEDGSRPIVIKSDADISKIH